MQSSSLFSRRQKGVAAQVTATQGYGGYERIGGPTIRLNFLPDPWRQIAIGVIFAIAISALVIGSIVLYRTRPFGGFTNDSVETTMLNVTTKANLTDASIDNAWIDQADMGAVEAENGTFVRVTSQEGTINTLTSQSVTTSSLEASEGTIETLESTTVTTETLNAASAMFDMTAHNAVTHNDDFVIDASHNHHILTAKTVPVTPDPFQNVPLGVFGSQNTIPIVDGLSLTHTRGYHEFIDVGGTTWLQAGEPEPVFEPFYRCDIDSASPTNGESTRVFFTITKNNVAFKLQMEISSEGFFYDFIIIGIDGLVADTHPGGTTTNPADPFIPVEFEFTNLQAGQTVQVLYRKDSACYGGYDYMRFRVTEMTFKGPITATFPSTGLDAFAGKDIQLCTGDGFKHRVDLTDTPFTFDRAGYFSTLKFDLGAGDCCVTVRVFSETKAAARRDDGCTVYCIDNLERHCIDPERPYETNPFHGWWRQLIKGPLDQSFYIQAGAGVPMVYIDATTNVFRYTSPTGSVNLPSEITVRDVTDGRVDRIVQTFSPWNRTLATWKPATDQSSFDALWEEFTCCTPFLQIQSDTGYLYQSFGGYASWLPEFHYDLLMERIPPNEVKNYPPIIPKKTGTTDVRSASDPTRIFDHFVDSMVFVGHSHLTKFAKDELWIGYPGAFALKELLKREEISHTTDVWKIFPTQIPEEGVTRLRFESYHHVAPPAQIEISGLTGDWAVMNGVHLTTKGMTTNMLDTNPLYMDYHPTDASLRTHHHDVGIFFNSTGLPINTTTGEAIFTGTPQLTVRYGAITASSDYIDTVSAMHYWFYETIKVDYHFSPFSYYDNDTLTPIGRGFAKPIVTWDDLAEKLASGVALTHFQYTRVYDVPSGIPINTASMRTWYDRTDQPDRNPQPTLELGMTTTDKNGRFPVRTDLDEYDENGRFFYHTVRQNYLQDVKVPYITSIGTTRTNPINLETADWYGQGGDTFAGLLVDFDDLPPDGYAFFNAASFPSGNGWDPYSSYDNADLIANKELFFVGRLNLTMTEGRSIGYLRFGSSLIEDFWGDSSHPTLTPPEFDGNPSLRPFEGYMKAMAPVFQYLVTELEVEDIIFDNRHNEGGYGNVNSYIRMFFGTDTYQIFDATLRSRADDGNGDPINVLNLERPHSGQERLYELLYYATPNTTEAFYPGSVFTGGQVIFLTDLVSGSAGDMILNFFLGDDLDKDLGGNTTVKIFGDLDGRNTGCFGGDNRVPYSELSPRLRDVNGDPLSAYEWSMDASCLLYRAQGPELTSIGNRVSALEVDCAPSLTGLAGGCPLPNDYEILTYPDLGYLPNTRPQLPGDARPAQPDPNNRGTWRDAWLEQAVFEALNSAPVAKKRSVELSMPRAPEIIKTVQNPEHMCPSDPSARRSLDLVPISEFTHRNTPIHVPQTRSRITKGVAAHEITQIFSQEIKNGGVCRDAESGALMVTSKCKNLPRYVVDNMPHTTGNNATRTHTGPTMSTQ